MAVVQPVYTPLWRRHDARTHVPCEGSPTGLHGTNAWTNKERRAAAHKEQASISGAVSGATANGSDGRTRPPPPRPPAVALGPRRHPRPPHGRVGGAAATVAPPRPPPCPWARRHAHRPHNARPPHPGRPRGAGTPLARARARCVPHGGGGDGGRSSGAAAAAGPLATGCPRLETPRVPVGPQPAAPASRNCACVAGCYRHGGRDSGRDGQAGGAGGARPRVGGTAADSGGTAAGASGRGRVAACRGRPRRTHGRGGVCGRRRRGWRAPAPVRAGGVGVAAEGVPPSTPRPPRRQRRELGGRAGVGTAAARTPPRPCRRRRRPSRRR